MTLLRDVEYAWFPRFPIAITLTDESSKSRKQRILNKIIHG